MAHVFCSPVHQAINAGNVDELKKLLRFHERIHVQDNLGWSPLHRALKKGRKEMVKVLLCHPDTQVNCRTNEGCTSLYLACAVRRPDVKIARDLLDHGADPNLPDDNDVGPLHLACKRSSLELVKLLVQHQANVNSQDCRGNTPLDYAADQNSSAIIEYLLTVDAQVTSTQPAGVNALHLACRNNALGLVKILIDRRADVNRQDCDGNTPLHCAVKRNAPQLIAYLLAHNADADLTDNGGLNALMATLQRRHGHFELLLPCTRNLDAVTADGWTALLLAITSSNLVAVRALLESGSSLIVNECAQSPFQLAAMLQHPELFELLWQHAGHKPGAVPSQVMQLFCERCPVPLHYEHYEFLLDVDLHAAEASALLHNIIQSESPTGAHFDAAKGQYLSVIGWLLDRNVQLQPRDAENMLRFFRHCPYEMELWKTILTKATPHITEHIVTEAVKCQKYDLALLLVTYCVHLNPENVIACRHGLAESFLRNWLALFTPAGEYRETITCRPLFYMCARSMQIVKDTGPIKSLLELSRDRVRQRMRGSCAATQDFLVALEKLDIRAHLKDVIRLRIPVNKYLLED